MFVPKLELLGWGRGGLQGYGSRGVEEAEGAGSPGLDGVVDDTNGPDVDGAHGLWGVGDVLVLSEGLLLGVHWG